MGHPGIAGWNEFRVFGYGVDFGQGDVVAEAVEQEVGEGWVGGGGLELVLGGEEAVDGVGDDFFDGFGGFGGGFGEVERGDLQAVEEQAGALGVKTAVGDALQDQADGGLDGASVLGEGQVEGGEGVARIGWFRGSGGVVVVAEDFGAERRAAAAAAVVVDVAALIVFGLGHVWGPPPPVFG